MNIKEIHIKNFRLFNANKGLSIDSINLPDGSEGSGLSVFLGENGCGKSSILDAFALPFLSYKADAVEIDDFHDPNQKIEIDVLSSEEFSVDGTMPKSTFMSVGFRFEAGIRSRATKAYLSSMIVSDQKFIKPVGQDKPKDGSPDLRVNVNNPFKGKRFDENDFLFLDKNRTFQTRSGTYNSTRFDRLMEDFDYKYVQGQEDLKDLNSLFGEIEIQNDFLTQALEQFKELSGLDLRLDFIDNFRPFLKSFFSQIKENNQQIKLSNLGSGYEMIFSLIYSFYLSQQSGKQLIALIDEPELHLHPSIQEKFVEFLIGASKNNQIIITTHSPLLVKQLLYNDRIKIFGLKKGSEEVELLSNRSLLLPWISANEINYLAFKLPTEEYHNELYGYAQELFESWTEKDIEETLEIFTVEKSKRWQRERGGTINGEPYDVTLPTFIRNQIHHPENKTMQEYRYSNYELIESIQILRDLIENG
ncbi:MAG: AAA family ATPase [Ekhidna sp.]|uniref:AAA family ATPase n=1 Tax=Ekhidna sp. TaxID=2608089 RepID=UPI0032ECF9F9